MTQPQPQLIVKPGGLTTGEHLVHILVVLVTCGLWIPGYIYFAVKAPKARYEVAIPYGADPAAVQALYAQVAAMNAAPQVQPDTRTPEERKAQHRQSIQIAVIVTLGVLAVLALVVANSWLSNH
jgi:hypothetical protein